MKKFLEGLSLPFFLIIGYLSHILFLFYTEQRIPNIADSVIIGFLSILYGFSIYMNHIKKPDAHTVLENKFIESNRELLNEIASLKAESAEKFEEIAETVVELNSRTNETLVEEIESQDERVKDAIDKLVADYTDGMKVLTSKVGAVSLKNNMTPSQGVTAKTLGW